jgi:uncharacterized protein YjbI with pentapeptide repeats
LHKRRAQPALFLRPGHDASRGASRQQWLYHGRGGPKRQETLKRNISALTALAFLLAASAIIISAAPVAHASSSYTAAASGDWASPTTWGGTAPPMTIGTSDFVTIPAGVTVTISSGETVVDNGAYFGVRSGALAVAGELDETAGPFTSSGTISVSGTLTLAGTSADLEDYGGQINVLTGGVLGVEGGGVSLDVNTTPCCTYASLSVAAGATLNNAGYIQVSGGGANLNEIVNEGTFNNNPSGTVDIAGGHFYNYLNFVNAPGAAFNTYDDLENYGTFVNEGSFYLGAGGVLSSGAFVSSGSLRVGFGLIFDSTGPFTNAGGGTALALGTLSVGPSGSSNENGATITVDGGVLENDGGTMTNDGSISIGPSPGSTFNNYGALHNDAGGSLTVQADGTYVGGALTNNGQVTNYGSFDSGGLENYAAIANEYLGQLTISSPLDYLINNAGATLTNYQGGTVDVGVADGLNNQGTIDNYGLISSTGSGSINSLSSYFYNHCPTGSVTAALTDNLLPVNVGCTLTFVQYTLPSGQEWGVTVNTLEAATSGSTGQLVWITASSAHYTGTGDSIQVPNLSGQGFSYSIDSPIASGPDITFNCEDTVLVPFTGSYYSCSGTGAATLTGTATILANYGESYHIPTTTAVDPGTASAYASDPNGVTFTVTVTDSNTAVSLAPGGAVMLSDNGAGGTFGDQYGDGPGSYNPYSCLYEVNPYTSQCQFTYYPNPVGSSTTTVTITATYQGDGYHIGSSGAAALTVTYYLACPQVPDSPGANLKRANLQDCELSGYNLSKDNLMGANLQGADLRNADLGGANLQGASLGGAVLDGASFQSANLQKADLSFSTGSGVSFAHANLQGSDLQGMQCAGCSFSGANLQGSDLSGGSFQSSDFTRSNMQSSNLSYGDFGYANFTGANTQKADVTGANFAGAIDAP